MKITIYGWSIRVPAQQHFLTNAKPRRSATFAPERLSSGDPLAWIRRGLVEAEERAIVRKAPLSRENGVA
jgi:hypothetical protein